MNNSIMELVILCTQKNVYQSGTHQCHFMVLSLGNRFNSLSYFPVQFSCKFCCKDGQDTNRKFKRAGTSIFCQYYRKKDVEASPEKSFYKYPELFVIYIYLNLLPVMNSEPANKSPPKTQTKKPMNINDDPKTHSKIDVDPKGQFYLFLCAWNKF